ncbi:MAG: tetratricopeptide repeat protein [Deltaproteobacteria bacterium]|nr:tetratricopeptide repeat protein [Deltaproteobacteria bacterium]
MSSRGSAIEEPLPYDEEFLYHLSRGSEFLIANRVGEAKEELERALVVQPRDAKGQDLLAGVYFRLGVYPRAIELWSVLVDQHPDDVPLRVNLGLAYLKTAQLEEAVTHLTRATSLDDTHARAWGYLGLALWREGRLDRARDAFMRGGQASMQRRMEEMLGISASAGGHSAPSLSVAPPPIEGEESPRRASIPPTEWARPEGSRGSIDLTVLDGGERISHPPTLRTALDRWMPRMPEGVSLGLSEGGLLVVTPRDGDVMVVAERALVVRGDVAGPTRPRHIAVPRGQQALLAAPDGHVIVTLSVGEGEMLYVVERHLLAYDEAGGGEARNLEVGGVSLRVVAIRGRTNVAVSCPRRPLALATHGESVTLAVARLIGWSGHLFPAASVAPDTMLLRGDGTVLVA